MAEEIDYQKYAEVLEKENERLRIHMASIASRIAIVNPFDMIVARWQKLSYVEKVYTVVMVGFLLVFLYDKVKGWTKDDE